MNALRCLPAGVLLAGVLGLSASGGLAQNPAREDPPRVDISTSQSWSVGGWSPWWGLAGGVGGGARPQTVEITKSFVKNCPVVVPTLDRSQSDFVLIVEHEGGKGVLRKDTKYAVFGATGDHIASRSVHMVGTAVRKACEAITKPAKSSAQTDTTVSSRKEKPAPPSPSSRNGAAHGSVRCPSRPRTNPSLAPPASPPARCFPWPIE